MGEKSSLDQMRVRFEIDVEGFLDLRTARSATVDMAISPGLIATRARPSRSDE